MTADIRFLPRRHGASPALTQAALAPEEGVTAAEPLARVRAASGQTLRSGVRQTPDLETVVADALVEEFQPQLLTVVRDFLTALWHTTRQTEDRPEAVPATDELQAVTPWLPAASRRAGPFPAVPPVPALGNSSALFSAPRMGPAPLPLARQGVLDLIGLPHTQEAVPGAVRLAGRPKPLPILPASPLAFGPSVRPQTLVRQPGLAPEGALPARREGPAEVLPLAARALPMTLPIAPLPPTPSEEHWRVQRAASGEPSAAPAGGEAHQQSVNLASQEKGAAANDVHLLANEVWSLLKRKLETESERLGRR